MLTQQTNEQITTLTLNRPEIHNAFDDELIRELTEKLQHLEHDPETRVVILAAEGKSFCAGADLQWMQKMANYSEAENIQDAFGLARLMRTLNTLSKPTIALVQGAAYGGGVGLVACCDIALAVPEANFCFSEVKLGLVPAVISPYTIAAIGERAARRYFLSAERFGAEEALRLGLIHQIVPAPELVTAGISLAQLLLKNGPVAMRATKQLIAEVARQSLTPSLIQKTVECIAKARVSEEGQERLKGFLGGS